MLDLAKHIVNQKSGSFEPEKFEDHYETALIDLINQKRAGKPIRPKERPRGENVVDLMEALRRRSPFWFQRRTQLSSTRKAHCPIAAALPRNRRLKGS
jgi:non-homologous end joining protein Ku